MTRQEALELLELQENATTEQIKQKYCELYNDYSLSLTNAPTDLLKKKFNSKLDMLNNALQLLCPDVSLDDLRGLNLPMDSPIFNVAPVYIKPQKTENKEPQKKETKRHYKLLLLAGFIFVISIAIGVYAIFSVLKNKDELVTTQQQLQKAADENTIYKRFAASVLENYKFRIENRLPESVYILWIAGIYIKNGKMENFDSYDYFVKPENRKKSEIRSGAKTTVTFTGYDGDVGYYVIMYQYKGLWYWRSGFFADDQRDKAIVIEPDEN